MTGSQPPSEESTMAASGIDLDSAGLQAARRRVVEAMFGATPSEPARTIGPYVVRDILGRGAMGVVYLASDAKLDRLVAVKVIGHGADDSAERRLMEEAKTLAKVQHPNVVTVFDAGRDERGVYIVMEYVAGTTLREWIRAERRPLSSIVDAFVQIGRGLAAVHAAGLVHRDFKPSNVLMGRGDRPLVADFGLALVERRSTGGFMVGAEIDVLGATMASPAIAGTLAYMAPEQLLGVADDRSDQFAFCISLFEALYGERPFAESAHGIPAQEWSQHVRAPAGGRAPGWLQAIVLRGLSHAPEDRWPSMNALAAALADDPRARRNRRLTYAGLGLTTAAALTAGAWAMKAMPSCDEAVVSVSEAWNPALGDALRDALVDVDRSSGASTFAVIEASMDRYADELRAAKRDACEATLVRKEQTVETRERRDMCLDRRVDTLAAVVEVASQDPGQLVLDPSGLMARLPPIDVCGDIERLVLGVAPPGDTDTAAMVQAALATVAVVQANLWADRTDLSKRMLDELRPNVEGVEYQPLQAAFSLVEGRHESHSSAFDRARARLMDAFFAAHAHRDDDVAAQAAIEMLFIAGYADPNPVEAALWARQAQAAAQRDGRARRPDLLTALAAWYRSSGQDEESLALMCEVVEARRQQGDPLLLARARANVALGLGRLERHREGEPYLRDALTAITELFGDTHPATLAQVSKLGSNLLGQRRYDEARMQLERAVEGFGDLLHNDRIAAWSELGRLHMAQERYDSAYEALSSARAVAIRMHGPASAQTAVIEVNLGAALQRLERWEEAAAAYQRGAEMFSPQGEPIINAAVAWGGHGQVLLEQAEAEPERAADLREGALESFRRSEEIVLSLAGATSRHLVQPVTGRADSLRRAGRAADAVSAARRAVQVGEAAGLPASALAAARFILAQSLVDAGGDRHEALALAGAALEGHADTKHAAEVRAWLDALESRAK